MPPIRRAKLAATLAALLLMEAGAAPLPDTPNPAVTFQPFHANGIYQVGERVGWTLRAPLGLGPQRFDYVIRENGFRTIGTGSVDLSSGIATLEAKLDEPGMIYARLTPAGLDPAIAKAETPEKLDRLTVGAAVAPTDLEPSVARPLDFDAFWAGKLALLGKVPINPALVPTTTKQPGVTLYTVTLASVGSHVHGYLAVPDTPGKHPALVVFQYAGVYPLDPATATARAAEGWITFDVDSHDEAPDRATAPKEYQKIGNTSRETSYFLAMYLRDTRALDYIRSRPDWDGHTIVLMGTSMGGQQSLVTAGLNPQRVTAVLVDVPSGADTNGDLHGRKMGYPNWDTGDPRVAKTARYFDTVNFAPHIRAPTLVAMGFIDTVAPPVGIWTAFDQIPGPKEAAPLLRSDHNNYTPQAQERFYRRSREALDQVKATGRFVPDEDWASHP